MTIFFWLFLSCCWCVAWIGRRLCSTRSGLYSSLRLLRPIWCIPRPNDSEWGCPNVSGYNQNYKDNESRVGSLYVFSLRIESTVRTKSAGVIILVRAVGTIDRSTDDRILVGRNALKNSFLRSRHRCKNIAPDLIVVFTPKFQVRRYVLWWIPSMFLYILLVDWLNGCSVDWLIGRVHPKVSSP